MNELHLAVRKAVSLNLHFASEAYIVAAFRKEDSNFMQQFLLKDLQSSRSIIARIFSPRSEKNILVKLSQQEEIAKLASNTLDIYDRSFIKNDMDRIHAIQLRQAAEDYYFCLNIDLLTSKSKRTVPLFESWHNRWRKELKGSSFSSAEN